MTTQEWAARLDGRRYGAELTAAEESDACATGMVIVLGRSDDRLELRGAISDETGAYHGTQVWLTREGLFDTESCPDKCRWWSAAYAQAQDNGSCLTVHWDHDVQGECDLSWSYSFTIPHSTFLIYEGDLPYCRGIVFALADLQSGEQ
jgi:hypothetical protein